MVIAKAPIDLVLQQGPMLQSIGRIGLQTALPFRRPKSNPAAYEPVQMQVAAPSRKLIEHFLQWSGADNTRPDSVPPHLFPQWSLAIASRLGEQTCYPLSNGLNQGCDLQINGSLPIGEKLQIRGEMVSVEETAGKARIQSRITTGTKQQSDILVADVIIVVPLPGKKKKSAKNDAGDKPAMQTIGNWDCKANDGLDFAILTGDFNPIHWLTPVAKISPFKGKILHGFGSFVRSYEVLAKDADLSAISVRFTKPVPIPSTGLQVQCEAGTKKTRNWQLIASNGDLHAAGSFTAR